MPHILKLNFLILALVYFSITSSAFADENFDNWYESLNDTEKVSQIFITGLKGPKLTQQERNLFESWPLSGVIYFKRNFKTQKEFRYLNQSALSYLGENAFSFTDQEGGTVIRVGTQYDSPSALSVGKLANKKITGYLGEAYGSLLKDLRISTNLAPVVDIKDDDRKDFISNRSYGSDSELVSNLSLEFSRGLLKSGTLPTLKHFPGIGGIAQDTHKQTPLKISNLETLKKRDWLPYIRHAEAEIPFFVMSSHTHFILDGRDLGIVTYSKDAIDKLRSITSENQVVITDDLEMAGARIEGLTFAEAAYKSFMSGHDLLLIGWPGRKLKQSLLYFRDKVGHDKEFDQRLKISLERIYNLKQESKKLKNIKPLFTAPASLKLSSTMNSKITNYLVKKEYKHSYERFPAMESLKSTLVFSSDTVFKKPFYNKLKTYSLIRTPNEEIYRLCKNKNCLLHLTGSKTSKKVANLLNNYNDRTFIIVNSVDPNLISSMDMKKHKVFNVLTRSYELGQQMFNWIERQILSQKENKFKESKAQKVVSLPQQN